MYSLFLVLTIASNPASPPTVAPAEASGTTTAQGPFGGFFRRLFKGKPSAPPTVEAKPQDSFLKRFFGPNPYGQMTSAQERKWQREMMLGPD
jgi:hypothetical protein